MQQADKQPTPWMQESVSMHKNPTQSGIRAWIKQGLEEKDTGKTEARRLMERGTAQRNKNLSEELK